MPPRKQDIPEAVYDLLVDLRLRIQAKSDHPAEVKLVWYEEAKAKCGQRTANLVLWLFDAHVNEVDLKRRLSTSPESQQSSLPLSEDDHPHTTSPNGASVAKKPDASIGSGESPEDTGAGIDLWGVIREGVRAVPSVKYALGVAAIAAVVALVVGWQIDVRIAVAGVVVMLVLMTALFVFAGMNKLKSPQIRYAAIFMMWAFVLLTVSWACLLTSSVFFNVPKSPTDLFGSGGARPSG
jgi:hypothetical protein